MRTPIIVLIFVLSCLAAVSQPYPKGYFLSPLDTVLILKGSFGEIRPDHFHSGIDLSTNEREGMPVHASAEGYVSRIKVSSSGFGKALYITHPNGYVTVYAHLQSFNAELEKAVLKIQYKKEVFEFDTLLKPKQLKVAAGELIALSGNSGDSEGPHLHFEIRDEKSEEPINPLLFGFSLKDTIPPVIKFIRLYPQAANGIVEMADAPVTYPVVERGGIYYVALPDYVKAYGNVAFGIETYDQVNQSNATLGVYSITLMADSQVAFQSKMDRFSFSDTRYANAAIDYSYRYETGNSLTRCFQLPGVSVLPFAVRVSSQSGYLSFTDDHAHFLQFQVSDYMGNTAELRTEVLSFRPFGKVSFAPPLPNANQITYLQGLAIHKTEAQIIFPPAAVYDKYYLPVTEESRRPGFFSKTILIGEPSIPLHAAFRIGLKPNDLPDSLREKAAVVRINKEEHQTALTGQWNDGFLMTQSREFGRFAIAVDTVPPVLNVLADTTATALYTTLTFQVQDNLTGVKSYRATLNGKWVLTEYNARTGRLNTILPSEELIELNEFQLTVTDHRNNSVSFRKVLTKTVN